MVECLLIVGLGNPGFEYENNRHNVGFQMIEAIAESVASNSFKKMSQIAEISSCFFEKKKIILAKPLTFMNLSGRSVRFLIDFYKIPIDKVIIFHDDIDLPFGRVKIKKGGGNGGHNGLKSIDNLAGTDYWRVRIGVGRPAEKSMMVSYVLGNFTQEEFEKLNDIKKIISENLSILVSNDPKKLESLINS
ncbi:MAG: aminoacyl-tRNA hydrolase [Alphaproteobacteria bacterium]|nr:aminoacyl-tRNA hydrolase [Alphaproteobacteria bacterium]